jgi:hypothetical protein
VELSAGLLDTVERTTLELETVQPAIKCELRLSKRWRSSAAAGRHCRALQQHGAGACDTCASASRFSAQQGLSASSAAQQLPIPLADCDLVAQQQACSLLMASPRVRRQHVDMPATTGDPMIDTASTAARRRHAIKLNMANRFRDCRIQTVVIVGQPWPQSQASLPRWPGINENG